MNDNGDKKIRLSAQPDHSVVAPGDYLEIPLVLTNLGDTPDRVSISIRGVPRVWVSLDRPTLKIQPGEQQKALVTVKPPASPNAQIGCYNLILRATSIIDPANLDQDQVAFTIAGFELKGRVDVLLGGIQFTAAPGERYAVPLMLISHGLGVEIFHIEMESLPEDWITIPVSSLRLEPGEQKEAALIIQPPRSSNVPPGTYPFYITITSQETHLQVARVDCTLTITSFVEYKFSLGATPSERGAIEQVYVQNFSNAPVSFLASWESQTDMLKFEPVEAQQIVIQPGGGATLGSIARLSNPFKLGVKTNFPYTVTIQADDEQVQTLEGIWISKNRFSVWTFILTSCFILFLILILIRMWLF